MNAQPQAFEPMCAHCVKAKAAVIHVRAENAALKVENATFRKQVHELKLKQLRHEQRRNAKRVEKRTALELADHLEFASGLDVVDLGHGRWKACCPAHDEKTPSLQITEKPDGAVLVYCFGGCPTEAVLESIGWEFAHLRPNE